MARIPANVALAASQSSVSLLEMVRMDFIGGVIAAHSGVGDIVYNSEVYKGVGDFGSISDLSESEEFRPQPVSVTLSGLKAELLAGISTTDYQGRDIDIFIGLIDQDLDFIGLPIPVWSGYMDVAQIRINESNASINMACESRLSRFNRAVVSRYTNADQQARFPGDQALEYVDQIPGQTLTWGGQVVAQPAAAPGVEIDENRLRRRQ